tara:strand:- start:506377 stop:508179 length:1803 start_codon:yes stop_codon:yes gene_type:complete
LFRRLNKRQLFGLSALPFFIWFIVAAGVFYKERVLYIDSAAQLFEMLLSADFEIYVSRYSMAINQFLPWLLINFNAPIHLVAIGYSLAMPIITCIAFYLCLFRWKNIVSAFAIILSAALAQHTFFHAISETMLLVPYASMFYASCRHHIKKEKSKTVFFIEAIILLLLAMFIHPVSVFFIAFVFWNAWLRDGKKAIKKLWPVALVFAAVFVGKMLMSRFSNATSHDDGFVSQLGENVADILMIGSFPSSISFVHLIQPMLWPVLLLMAVGILIALVKKQYKSTLGNALFIAAFFLVTLLIYRQGDSLIGMERAFLPLAFMGVVMASGFIISCVKSRILTIAFPILIVVLSVTNIHRALPDYEQRQVLLAKSLQKTNQLKAQKFYWKPSETEQHQLLSNWALSIESLLLSQINHQKCMVLFSNANSVDSLLVTSNEPAIPYTSFQTMMYDDQINSSNYFTIGGKVYPFISETKSFSFSGMRTDFGLFCSNDQSLLSKSKDNWRDDKLLVTADNPYQNVVEIAMLPLSEVHFSAYVSPGATIVVDGKKAGFGHATNETNAWKEISVNFEAPDSAVNVLMYAYNNADSTVYFKDLSYTIHVPK